MLNSKKEVKVGLQFMDNEYSDYPNHNGIYGV